MLNEFLNRYNFPQWKVKYRPGAPFTVGFGLDDTFNCLRIHPAVDRGALDGREMWLPFDADKITWEESGGGFGSILRIFVSGADFEMRIMHTIFDDLSPVVREAIRNGYPVKAGTFLGMCGNLGLSVGSHGGHHTHTEVASIGKRSQILDAALYKTLGDRGRRIDVTYVRLWCENRKKHGKNYDCNEQIGIFFNEFKKRKIVHITDAICVRSDYYDGKEKTFYNSQVVFNGL